jgi:hypothetical protein
MLSDVRLGGCLYQFGRLHELGCDLHDDERHDGMLGDRKPGGQCRLLGGTDVYELGECDTGVADDYVHDERAIECGVYLALHGSGDGEFRAGGGLHQQRIVHELEYDLHDDERHGQLFGDREPGRQHQLLGGTDRYTDGDGDAGDEHGDVHDGTSGERGLQLKLHGGGLGQGDGRNHLHEQRRLYEHGCDLHDDERDDGVFGDGNAGSGFELWVCERERQRNGNEGVADNLVHDAGTSERGVRLELHGGGDGDVRAGGGLHQQRIVHELGRDLHDDEQHG